MRTRGSSEGLRWLRSPLGDLPGRSRAIPALAALAAALAVVAFAATTGPSGPELSLTAGGGGPLSIQNSEDGSLLTVGGMAPGDTEAGAVTITNTGSRPGDLTVSSVDLEDLPGMGGGQLSERLQLSVTERGAPGAADEVVFSGPLGAMDRIELGRLAPDDARTFRFSVSFPNGGTPSSPLTLRRRLARGEHPVMLVRAVGVSPSGQRTNVEKRVVLLP